MPTEAGVLVGQDQSFRLGGWTSESNPLRIDRNLFHIIDEQSSEPSWGADRRRCFRLEPAHHASRLNASVRMSDVLARCDERIDEVTRRPSIRGRGRRRPFPAGAFWAVRSWVGGRACGGVARRLPVPLFREG